jgi:hypothetical protein
MSALAPVPLAQFPTLAHGFAEAEGVTWDREWTLCAGEAGPLTRITSESDGSAGAVEEVARIPASLPHKVALAAEGMIQARSPRRSDGEVATIQYDYDKGSCWLVPRRSHLSAGSSTASPSLTSSPGTVDD